MAGRQDDKDDCRIYGRITVTLSEGAADPRRIVIYRTDVLEDGIAVRAVDADATFLRHEPLKRRGIFRL